MSGEKAIEEIAAPRRARLFRTPVVAGLLIVIALLIHTPSLWRGFQYDDFLHQYMLRYGMKWPDAAPTRLYDFSFWSWTAAAENAGNLAPWWVSPDFKVRFFRPVSSLTIWLDSLVHGNWAAGYHITNLALFAIILFLVWRLFINLGATPRAATWALAFYALCGNHALPVEWIANRNELCSSLFVIAMMLNFCRYRRLGGSLRLVASASFFLLACMSKESGLVGLLLIGFYLLILDAPGRRETFFARCLRVLRSPVLWIFILITAAYLAIYLATGHGTTSQNYATPGHRTFTYIGRLAALFPLATGSLFFGVSTDLVFTRPQLYWPVLALDIVLFVLLLRTLWHRLRAIPLAWFAAGWMVAALLPMAGVTLSDRLLMSTCVGSSLLLGVLLDSLGDFRDILADRRSRFVAAVFIICSIVIAVPVNFIRAGMFSAMAAADREAILAADIGPVTNRRNFVFLNSPSTLLALSMQPTWTVVRNDTNTVTHFLAMARLGEHFLRESDDTLLLTFDEPFLLTHRYERIFHTAEEPPPPGRIFTTSIFTATIVATEGIGIRAVRFKFRENLDHSPCHFLVWQSGGYHPATLPPIGGRLDLPRPTPTIPWVP